MNKDKLKEISNATLRETRVKLDRYKKALVVRSTGFGKTYMALELSKEEVDNGGNVLYIAPHKVNLSDFRDGYKERFNEDNINIDTVTYYYISRNSECIVEKMGKEYELIILDEVHCAGAKLANKGIGKLLKNNEGTKLLGITATEQRMDGFDVERELFGSRCRVFDYTLGDAVSDDVLSEIWYVRAHYDMIKEMRVKKEELEELDYKCEERVGSISNQDIYNMCCVNMGDIIRKNIEEAYNHQGKKVPGYMQFIVFFYTHEILYRKQGELIEWMQGAFKDREIRVTNVISDSKENKANALLVNEYEPKDGVIDLICNCNMLNMGKHLEHNTGVILLRATESDCIFKQQIGRCMSVTKEDMGIVFDLVSNIDRQKLIKIGGETAVDVWERTGKEEGVDRTWAVVRDETVKQAQMLDKLEEYAVGTRVDEAVGAFVNWYMPIKECERRYKVRKEYIYNKLKELCVAGELFREVADEETGKKRLIQAKDIDISVIEEQYKKALECS